MWFRTIFCNARRTNKPAAMNDLYIDSTIKTPLVICKQSGEISIKGRALPEDAASFFFPLVDWVSDYYRQPAEFTQVVIDMEYLNSASQSMMGKLFFGLEPLARCRQEQIQVVWIADDDDTDMHDLVSDLMHSFPELPVSLQVRTEGIRKTG
jgi:hypothetical protein